ncbi:MAG: potassium transporter TrkH [Holdemanella sp.]|nr:potassium transporter TrkH [Holdemanella sp.]
MNYIKTKKRGLGYNATFSVAFGFFVAILVGSLLLYLPICQSGEYPIKYVDALFTATTSVCVTGLVTVPTFSAWSTLGHIVITILIEVGGLGVVTFMIVLITNLGGKVGLKESIMIQTAYNVDRKKDMVKVVYKTLIGALVVQMVGALLYMIVFVPEFGLRGIWISIFNSVSGFCNAGMDIIGPDSLIPYQSNLLINIVTSLLIVLGGIGFPIWWFTLSYLKERDWKKHIPISVRIVLTSTLILIFGGALLILLFEYNNPDTIGNLPFGDKVLVSIFQSVTTRTAGFATVAQEKLRMSTVVLCSVLMFIGGSPSGTAGGIKTTTLVIVFATVISIVMDRDETVIFRRKINAGTVRQAFAIFMFSLTVMIVGLTLLCVVCPGNLADCLYEIASAIGTVGLTRALTPGLSTAGKYIVIATMYLGRIGPITLSIFFGKDRLGNKLRYAEESVNVG